MRSKTIIALSTAIFLGVLGASSMALANDRDDGVGGYRVGPLGQVLGTPNLGNATGRNAYGFVPSVHSKQAVHKKAGNAEGRNAFGSAAPARSTGNDANIAIQDWFYSRSN